MTFHVVADTHPAALLFVPLGYLFSRFGLNWFWLTFPVTETLTTVVGAVFYRQFLSQDYVSEPKPVTADDGQMALKPSRPGVIITIAREHGSSGKQIGKLVAQKLGIPFYYGTSHIETVALLSQAQDELPNFY